LDGNSRRSVDRTEENRPSKVGLEEWLFPKQSDEELMLACRDGSDDALEQLFKRYHRPLFAFVCRYLRDVDRAEDVVQEVFFRVYNNRENYQPTAKFSSWVYRIARNLCIDEKRRLWSRSVVLDSQISDDSGSEIQSMAVDRGRNAREKYSDKSKMDLILEAIESLSDEQREVMLLHKYEGLSYKEIAEILDVTPESVKQRAYRAHMRLRHLLRPLMEEVAS
jgi:RNA polymerase sigma-70 factor (ECF subfamily)